MKQAADRLNFASFPLTFLLRSDMPTPKREKPCWVRYLEQLDDCHKVHTFVTFNIFCSLPDPPYTPSMTLPSPNRRIIPPPWTCPYVARFNANKCTNAGKG